MNLNELTIATITLVREAAEESLLKESLLQLADLQIPVYITDGGSPHSFIRFLRSIPHFRLSATRRKGVWAQAMNSMKEAGEAGTPFIVYTEPDKLNFFKDHLPAFLRKIEVDEQTGVYLVSRNAKGFKSFPAFQQMTETTINHCCAEIMGKAVDYTYGPFLLRRDLVPLLKLIQEDVGWGWRPFAFNMACRKGLTVNAYEATLLCPTDQKEDSSKERIYRMKQLEQNIRGLVLSTQVALPA
jgi:hypothetical protein